MESFNKTSDTSTIKTSRLALYCLRFALSFNKISGTSTIKTSKLALYCLRFALSLPWRIKSAYNNNIQLMAHLPDDIILNGFISFNDDMTKEYFYGYCRRAYSIYDSKYQLHGKAGLDFYSLAHDYYIQLLTHHFEPLLKKPKAAKLSTWMVRGFHFVVLDALKAYNKEYEHLSEEASDVVLEYVRSTDKEEGMLLQVAEAVASHYHDRMMQEIAHMVFYAGFKQKDVAAQLGITPAAVNMRYKKMMEEVVTPYVIENYGEGLTMAPVMERCMEESSADVCFSRQSTMSASLLPRFANWQQESEKKYRYHEQKNHTITNHRPEAERNIRVRFKPAGHPRRRCGTCGETAFRCRNGTGRRNAGTVVCHPNHAGRHGDHQALRRRIRGICPSASRTPFPRHCHRLRHSGIRCR